MARVVREKTRQQKRPPLASMTPMAPLYGVLTVEMVLTAKMGSTASAYEALTVPTAATAATPSEETAVTLRPSVFKIPREAVYSWRLSC